jgi:RNA polymerase sigma-70 factor (ECF subfamily)
VWLFTIMFNLFIDRCRRRTHELSLDPLASSDLPAPEPEETQPWEEISAERLRAALERLDPPFRDVVDLHWTARCSYQEISERLGIPLGTVGTRLLRARQKLRTLLASPVAQA